MNKIQQFASKKIYLKMVYVKWGASLFRCQCVWNVKVRTKWPLLCRRHFECISISLKSTLLILPIMWSSRAYWQYVIIDAGNDLAPNRHQAIAWTSDGLVLRCIEGSRFSSIYQGWGRVGLVPSYHINQKYLVLCRVMQVSEMHVKIGH